MNALVIAIPSFQHRQHHFPSLGGAVAPLGEMVLGEFWRETSEGSHLPVVSTSLAMVRQLGHIYKRCLAHHKVAIISCGKKHTVHHMAYLTSPPVFSSAFWSGLRFKDLATLPPLPAVLPPNSVITHSWVCSPSLPHVAESLNEHDAIPHIGDLKRLLVEYEAKEKEGYNAVRIVVRLKGTAAEERLFSLTKVC